MTNTSHSSNVSTRYQAIVGVRYVKATFYHAGCPICVGAEHMLTEALDHNKYTLEAVHLGEQNARIDEAEAVGVESVPALVIDNQVFHINFGASLADLKS